MGLQNSKVKPNINKIYSNFIKTDGDILLTIDNQNENYGNKFMKSIPLNIENYTKYDNYYLINFKIPQIFNIVKYIRNLKINVFLKNINIQDQFRIFLDSNDTCMNLESDFNIDLSNDHQYLYHNLFISKIGDLFIKFYKDCRIKSIILRIETKYF